MKSKWRKSIRYILRKTTCSYTNSNIRQICFKAKENKVREGQYIMSRRKLTKLYVKTSMQLILELQNV